MTDDQPTSAAPVVRVAQDLTAIVDLCGRLLTQAVHTANDRELPGGEAMVALGPVADPSQYAENVEAAEWRHEANPRRWPDATLDLGHEDDDLAPVLQILRSPWSNELREHHGYPLEGRRPTVASEANIIRQCLDWCWDNDPRFDHMAADVRGARRRLENILHDGERATVTRVECDRCDAHARLIRVYGDDPTGMLDEWKCPACKARLTEDDLKRAQATQLRREGAAKYVPLRDAVAVLTNLGRPERTVRSWLADEDEPVEVYCEVTTRRSLVWWPDLWRRHLTTRLRKRGAA